MDGAPQVGPALAVGRMALTSGQVGGSGKGKAVNIVHTWKDHLWEMGGKEDPPTPRVLNLNQQADSEVGDEISPSNNLDIPAETKSESPNEGSSQLQDELPTALPKEERNPLSRQGRA